MTNPDAGLLDELARCYAAAVVRNLLEGQEECLGEQALPKDDKKVTEQEAST